MININDSESYVTLGLPQLKSSSNLNDPCLSKIGGKPVNIYIILLLLFYYKS